MRLRDERGDVRDLCLSRLHGKMREEFDIALRALDRRKRQVPYGKMQGIGQREEALQHIRVEPDGRFVLEEESGQERSYLFKEVQYLL